jgi:hypothetical protein
LSISSRPGGSERNVSSSARATSIVSRAAVTQPVQIAAYAVGEPAVHADLIDEPRGESAAQQGVGNLEREVVGIVHRHGDIADPDLALGEVGLVDHEDLPAGEVFRLEALDRRRFPRDLLPAAEKLFHQLERLPSVHIAHHGEDAAVGTVVLLVKRGDLFPREARDALLGPVDGAGIRMTDEHGADKLAARQ